MKGIEKFPLKKNNPRERDGESTWHKTRLWKLFNNHRSYGIFVRSSAKSFLHLQACQNQHLYASYMILRIHPIPTARRKKFSIPHGWVSQFFAVIVVSRFFQGVFFYWKNEQKCRNMFRTECDPCTTRTTRRGKYMFVSNTFSCTRRPVRARTVFSAIDTHTTVSHYDDRLIGGTVTQSCKGVWRSRVDRRRINEKNSLRTRSIPFENALPGSDEMTGIGKCSTVWN